MKKKETAIYYSGKKYLNYNFHFAILKNIDLFERI